MTARILRILLVLAPALCGCGLPALRTSLDGALDAASPPDQDDNADGAIEDSPTPADVTASDGACVGFARLMCDNQCVSTLDNVQHCGRCNLTCERTLRCVEAQCR